MGAPSTLGLGRLRRRQVCTRRSVHVLHEARHLIRVPAIHTAGRQRCSHGKRQLPRHYPRGTDLTLGHRRHRIRWWWGVAALTDRNVRYLRCIYIDCTRVPTDPQWSQWSPVVPTVPHGPQWSPVVPSRPTSSGRAAPGGVAVRRVKLPWCEMPAMTKPP